MLQMKIYKYMVMISCIELELWEPSIKILANF